MIIEYKKPKNRKFLETIEVWEKIFNLWKFELNRSTSKVLIFKFYSNFQMERIYL